MGDTGQPASRSSMDLHVSARKCLLLHKSTSTFTGHSSNNDDDDYDDDDGGSTFHA